MEAESVDVEDGEIVDEEALDTFGPYKILQRPITSNNPEKLIETNYSDDESENTSESGSDSDSQILLQRMKRPKLKAKRRKITGVSTVNDKYKIWCTQVQEEALTENLVSCGVTKKMHQGRNVENYDLPRHYHHNDYKQTASNNSSDDEIAIQSRSNNKRSHSDRHNFKLRLRKRQSSMDVDIQKGSVKMIPDLSTTIESSDSAVASDIAEKLNEKKDSLIARIVGIIGKGRAIEFYEKTKEIEEDGGMLIMNGSRRRTPGGVYLNLIKNNDHIPQEQIREIFAIDKKEVTDERRKSEAARIREKANKLMKKLENGSDKNLPALLTRAELSTQIAEEARLRRGEVMNRIPTDSDLTVSNPPPSPVTDDPDHSENVSSVQRRIQDYSEDFLDIGVDIDSMEMF